MYARTEFPVVELDNMKTDPLDVGLYEKAAVTGAARSRSKEMLRIAMIGFFIVILET